MSAQHPDDRDERRFGGYVDGEPVDPYARDHRQTSPPVDHDGGYGQAHPTYPGYRQPYPTYPGYRPYAVAPRSPALGLIVSFFIPGLGSMINGSVGKGVGILVGYAFSMLLTIVLVGYVGMLVFWIWGMVDGYRSAQRWNARYGIVS